MTIKYTHYTYSSSGNDVYDAPAIKFPLSLKEKIGFSDTPDMEHIWIWFVCGGYLVTVEDSQELQTYYFFDADTTDLLWKMGTYTFIDIIWEEEGVLHCDLTRRDKAWYARIDVRTGRLIENTETASTYYEYMDQSVLCVQPRIYDTEDESWNFPPHHHLPRTLIVNDTLRCYGVQGNMMTAFDLNQREIIWRGKVAGASLGDHMGPVGDGLLLTEGTAPSSRELQLLHLASKERFKS